MKRLWPYAAWLGLVVLFLWDCVLAGRAPYMRDTFCDMIPWRQFAGQAFADGAIPLWNHYSNGSGPFMAMPQSAVFYPLHFPFYIFPASTALVVWLILHLWISGASMYGLARHWRLDVAAAFLASIAFTFSTYTIAQMEFQSLFAVLAFTPLTLWLCSRWAEKHSLRDAAMLSFVLALQCLAGHPQTLIYNIFMAMTVVIVIGREKLLRSMGGFLASGVLAMGLCAAQLLLTFELLGRSTRGVGMDSAMDAASFHPHMLMGLIMPFIAGKPGYQGQWWGIASAQGQTNWTLFEFSFATAYVGVATVILATLVPICFFRKRREVLEPHHRILALLLFFIAGAGLAVAMGKYSPLSVWLYEHAPLFDRMRWPAKALHLVVFAMSMLGALGLQLLSRQAAGRWVLAMWAAFWVAMAVGMQFIGQSPAGVTWLTGGAFLPIDGMAWREQILTDDYMLAVLVMAVSLVAIAVLMFRRKGAAAVVVIVFANLFLISRPIHFIADGAGYDAAPAEALEIVSRAGPTRVLNTDIHLQQELYGHREVNGFLYARSVLLGDSGLPYHVSNVLGGGTLRPKAFFEFYQGLGPDPMATAQGRRMAAVMNLGFLINKPKVDAPGPLARQFQRVAKTLPRAMVLGRWQVAEEIGDVVAQLLRAEHDPFTTVIVDRGEPKDVGVNGEVLELVYDWNRVTLKVRAPGRAVVLLNDSWYPGWQATVDGRAAPILHGNGVFCAVMVEAGEHTVEFVYEPWQFKVGMIIAACSALLLIGAFVAGGRGGSIDPDAPVPGD